MRIVFGLLGAVVLILIARRLWFPPPQPQPPLRNSFHVIFDVTGSTKSSVQKSVEQFEALFNGLPAGAVYRASLLHGMNSELVPLAGGDTSYVPDDSNIEKSEIRKDVITRIQNQVTAYEQKQSATEGHSCLFRTLLDASRRSRESNVENILFLTDAQEDCEYLASDGDRKHIDVLEYKTPEQAADAIPRLGNEVASHREELARTAVFFILPRKFLEPDPKGTRKSLDWLERFWERVFTNQQITWRSVRFGVEPPTGLPLLVGQPK